MANNEPDDEPTDSQQESEEQAAESDQPAEQLVDSGDQPADQADQHPAEGDQSSQLSEQEEQAIEIDQPAPQPDEESTLSPAPTGTTQMDDPGKPYLFVDLYPLDVGPHPPWSVVVETSHFVGAIIKAWEGAQYNDHGWFADNWQAVRDAGGDRYGASWFRGAYLFVKFNQSGADQADAYLQAINNAGGWDNGDIYPIVDVELGSERNSNRQASAQEVIDCITECAQRLRGRTGRRVILYGRGAMRDLSINDRMGCDAVWNPSYTATMVKHGLEPWDLEDIALWQYCGDGTAAIQTLPHEVPGFGKVDISVYVKGAQTPTLEMVREGLVA
jgi:hypothetical protein